MNAAQFRLLTTLVLSLGLFTFATSANSTCNVTLVGDPTPPTEITIITEQIDLFVHGVATEGYGMVSVEYQYIGGDENGPDPGEWTWGQSASGAYSHFYYNLQQTVWWWFRGHGIDSALTQDYSDHIGYEGVGS